MTKFFKSVKFPKKVMIGGHDYKIVFPHVFNEVVGRLGMVDHSITTISIGDCDNGIKMSPQIITQVFLHELTHAIDFIYDNNKLEEVNVEYIANGWYDILFNNNLFLTKSKLKIPKKISIGGFIYNVNYPYVYREFNNGYLSADHTSLNFDISNTIISNSAIQQGLIQLLLSAICAHYQIKYEFSELRGLSNGFYQVFKDINMEEIVKRNI